MSRAPEEQSIVEDVASLVVKGVLTGRLSNISNKSCC